MNSLKPLGNRLNNTVSNVVKNVSQPFNNMMKNVTEPMVNAMANVSAPIASASASYIALAIFVTLIGIFLVLFIFFSKEIKYGFDSFYSSLRSALGETTPLPDEPKGGEITKDDTPLVKADEPNQILDKILPMSKEVFNVSSNRYTFYDAEPLCKALGAELATYDQVKEAWAKGADWCNYGWVKGQQALYPTQKGTWDKLQMGPEGDRTKCGEPGVNGGYFDNPELRLGVNCYGPKPPQSQHDATKLEEGAPMSPEVLEYNKKVARFRTDAQSVGVMPYSSEKWSST